MYDASEAVRIVAVLLGPVMPSSSRAVLTRVGDARDPATLRLERDAAWTTPPGAERRVIKAEALWPRLEPDRTHEAAAAVLKKEDRQVMVDNATEQPPASVSPAAAPAAEPVAPAPGAPQISIDEFAKVELKVGRVVAAEAVPKSKKLLRLEIETGSGVRQVVSGIAKAYEPDTLIGRHVVFVANLKPAKLVGIESNGMVLAATAADGEAVLLTPDDPERAPAGSQVR